MQRPDSQVHDRRSVPESGHRAPKKKKMSKGTKALLIIVCVIVAIALLLVGTVLILSAVGRSALTDDGSGINIMTRSSPFCCSAWTSTRKMCRRANSVWPTRRT